MAAITITDLTPADSNAKSRVYEAGVAVAIGETVYKATATTDYRLAQADGTEEEAEAAAIAISAAAADGDTFQGAYAGRWKVTLSAGTLTAGEYYVLDGAGAAGKLSPRADLGSSDYATYVMWAESTTIATINPIWTGTELA